MTSSVDKPVVFHFYYYLSSTFIEDNFKVNPHPSIVLSQSRFDHFIFLPLLFHVPLPASQEYVSNRRHFQQHS